MRDSALNMALAAAYTISKVIVFEARCRNLFAVAVNPNRNSYLNKHQALEAL